MAKRKVEESDEDSAEYSDDQSSDSQPKAKGKQQMAKRTGPLANMARNEKLKYLSRETHTS